MSLISRYFCVFHSDSEPVSHFCSLIYQVVRDSSSSSKSETESLDTMKTFSVTKEIGSLLNHSLNIVFYCLCNRTYR